MGDIKKRRRGTTAEHATFAGDLGECTYDEDKKTGVWHDGETLGGFPSKRDHVSATNRLLGRSSALAGPIEEIPCTAAARALLDDADAAAMRATLEAKRDHVSAADRLLGRSSASAGVIEEIPCTAAGRALLDDEDAEAQRATLELGDLATEDAVTSADIDSTGAADGHVLTADGAGGVAWEAPPAPAAMGLGDFWEETHFLHAGSDLNACWGNGAINGGSVQGVNTALLSGWHHGHVRMRCVATTNSGGRLFTNVNSFRLGQTPVLRFRAVVLFQALASTESIRVGFSNSLTEALPTQGVYLFASNGAIEGRAVKDSTTSTTSTTFAPSLDTWYVLEIDVAANGSSVTFRVRNDSGTEQWSDTLATNIPVDADEAVGCGVIATSTIGSQTDMVAIDYLGVGTVGGLLRARGA